MKIRLLALLLILLPLIGAGCTSAQVSTPAPVSTTAPAATPKVTPAPEKPTAAADAWQKRWDDTLAAAKKEGTVTIYGELASEAKQGLTEAFKKNYGINVEIVTGTAADIATRYIQETTRDLYLADVLFNGDTTFINVIKPKNVLAKMEPNLILPDTKDAKLWPGGAIPYLDNDKTIIESTVGRNPFAIINTDMVKPDEIRSFQDYLNPKWKGQIAMFDPTIGGATSALFTFILNKIYPGAEGEQYLAKLAKQEPVISRDKRLPVEWVAKGKYPIHITPSMQVTVEFMKLGAPIKDTIEKEGFLMHPSSSNFALAAKPAHPNAAIILANWLLSREAGTILSQAWGAPASRLDVPTTGLESWRLALTTGEKMFFDDEQLVSQNPRTQEICRALGMTQ